MAVTTGADAVVVVFAALSDDEQEEAFARLSELRLRRQAGDDSSMERHIRSLRRVAEYVGHAP